MDSCALTRLLVPAFLVGTVVATLVGSDVAGWVAAALAGGLLLAIGRVRGTSASCALPAPPVEARERVDAGAGPTSN